MAWLIFTAMVGIAGQFTDRSKPEPATPSSNLLARSSQPRALPAEADPRRLVKAQPAVARARIEHVAVSPTP